MRLLNLWPDGQVVQPVRRFVLEIVFALLLVTLLTLASWMWVDGRLNQAVKAHQTLQSEWAQLKQQRAVQEESIGQMPRFLRQMVAGELDWMGELPQWTQGGRVRWLSAKVVDDHLLLDGLAQDGAAIEAVAEQIRARYPTPPLSISEVSGVSLAGQKWWRFSMRIEGVDPLYRWIVSPPKTQDSALNVEPNTHSHYISWLWGVP